MNTSDGPKYNRVFIGNMPFDTNEEELKELCEQIGPVETLNIPKEKDSEQKGRGFAFCDFPDNELALSAIRNLTGYEMKKRQLRVNFTNGKDKDQKEIDDRPDTLETAIEKMTNHEKFFLFVELKELFHKNKEKAIQLLVGNPKILDQCLKMQEDLQSNQNSANAAKTNKPKKNVLQNDQQSKISTKNDQQHQFQMNPNYQNNLMQMQQQQQTQGYVMTNYVSGGYNQGNNLLSGNVAQQYQNRQPYFVNSGNLYQQQNQNSQGQQPPQQQQIPSLQQNMYHDYDTQNMQFLNNSNSGFFGINDKKTQEIINLISTRISVISIIFTGQELLGLIIQSQNEKLEKTQFAFSNSKINQTISKYPNEPPTDLKFFWKDQKPFILFFWK